MAILVDNIDKTRLSVRAGPSVPSPPPCSIPRLVPRMIQDPLQNEITVRMKGYFLIDYLFSYRSSHSRRSLCWIPLHLFATRTCPFLHDNSPSLFFVGMNFALTYILMKSSAQTYHNYLKPPKIQYL